MLPGLHPGATSGPELSLHYEAWTLPWDSGGFKRVMAKIHEIEGSGSGKVSFLGSTGDGQVTISVAKLEEAGRSLSEIISDTTSSLIRVYDSQADGTTTIIDEWVTERVERVHSDNDRRVKISGPILKQKAFDGAIVYPNDYPAAVTNPALQDHIWGGNEILSNPGFEDPTEVPNVWEIWHDHSAGTFTISDGTDTTSLLDFDFTAGEIETELEADLGTITDVHVTGDGSEDDPWTIEWVDPINDTFIDNITLTADFGSLSGGTEAHITETVVGHLVPSGWTKAQTVSRGVIQIFGAYDNFQMVVSVVDTGTYALLVNPGPVPPRFAGAQQVPNAEPGLTYQASIRINPVSGTDTFRFVIRDVNGGFIASDSGGLGSSSYSAGVYSTITITDVVIPDGVKQVIYRISNTNATGNPSGFRVDNASLTEGLAETTWGDIIQILMDDAAVDHAADARGPVLDWIDYTGFDATNDSSSVAWARNESYTARFGQLYGQVFDDGVDLGYEWSLTPKATPSGGLTHDLNWYNTDNLDATPATAINVKQAVTGGQVTRRIPDFTSLIVEGAEGEYVEAASAAEGDFGHLEKYDLAGQLSSSTSITARKDQLFSAEAANRTAVQFTIIETPNHPRPLVTYVPGDTLPMQLPPDLVKVTRRVQEVTYVNTFPTQYTVTGSRILTGEAAAYDLVARLWRKFDKPAIQRRRGAADVTEDGGGGGGMFTVAIAGSDALESSQKRADFVASGANDEATFKKAIDKVPSTGGRILYEGTFRIGAAIAINKANVHLVSTGGQLVVDANNINIIEITAERTTIDGVTIINPDAHTTVTGILINFPTSAVSLAGGPIVKHFQTSDLDNSSIRDVAGSFAYRLYVVDSSFFTGATAAVIDLNATGDVRIVNNWFVENITTDIINIAGTWKGLITDNFLWNNTGTNNFVLPSTVVAYHNYFDTSQGTTNDGDHPLTTKGDIYTYGTVDARLGVGSNDQVLTADSGQSLGVKWAAAASGGTGKAVIAGFTEDNLAASLTDSQLYRDVQSVDIQIPVVMSHSGHIVGVSVAASEVRTAGTATFEVFKNTVATGLTTVLDGTDTQYASSTQATSLDTFVADDRLDIRVTTDGSWAPTTADVEAAITVQFDDASSNSWQAFTPTWTASSVNPVIGNGTLSGRYVQIGDTVHFWLSMVAGSTTTFGTGTWRFSPPITAATANETFPVRLLEQGVDNDMGIGYFTSTTNLESVSEGGNVVTSGSPFAWGDTDIFMMSGTYEA